MKSIYLVLSLFFALFLSSCGSDSSTGNNPFVPGGGGGGTGNISYTITLVNDPNTNVPAFVLNPSANATITKVTVNCAAAGVNNEEFTGDGTTVYMPNAGPTISTQGITLANGQQWTFKIEGKEGSSTGAVYTANANYTIQ
ncbi:MAG: hypothetical protein WAT71_15240 [Ignavibacteria bacterium]